MSNTDDRLDELLKSYHELDKKIDIMSANLESHYKKDEENLDKIGQILDNIDEELEHYGEQLAIHIAGVKEARRYNDLLHEELKLFRKTSELRAKEHELRLNELEKPAIVIKGILWTVGAITAILGLITLVRNVF